MTLPSIDLPYTKRALFNLAIDGKIVSFTTVKNRSLLHMRVVKSCLNPFILMLQILINATVGSSGYRGDIAIDDLTLSVSNCSQ